MALTLSEFRELVRQEFGSRLERATPASVRDFLDRMQLRLHQESGEGSPYVVEADSPRSYEEIVSEFFARALDYPPEQAFIMLWLLAFEQHFAMLEEDYARRFITIFGEGEIN
jgi:hypothetical protein